MPRFLTQIRRLLVYFQARPYEPVSLDWLARGYKVKPATVQRYISEVRRRCPRGWRIRTEYQTDDLGLRRTFYVYCPSLESFRKQKELWKEAG